jgi:flagellar protein FliS
MKKMLGTYQKVQAGTASPGQRVLMVYNGISKNLQLALDNFQSADPDRFMRISTALTLAQRLILELQLALDMDKGGDIAKNLKSLYMFWRQHLSDGNVKKDSKKVREVLQMVKELTESWIVAERKTRTGA